ncbi:metallophosphoesterase [Paenibacillus aurantiacus]|uniref:Metallophosphoesterase n=1 Tax=Paenibacillus aurantiacus TaxID=1936118 RepID=A0ABV5L4I3_9BACL
MSEKQNATSSHSRRIPSFVTEKMANPKTRKRMVEWYNPKQLIITGTKTVLSTIFGLYSDFRLLESYGQEPEEYVDLSRGYQRKGNDGFVTDEQGFYFTDAEVDRDEIWIDYVSDLGDGFNSTYTIAYYLTRSRLTIRDIESNNSYSTSRGDILIFGGDQVYPTANRKEYKERLIAPYHMAMGYSKDPHPQLFAIPGNHDWYDGLLSFTRLFCSRKWFNGWQCPQTKSYFGIKLPHKWWLLGTDVQLNSDIDGPQVKFFENLADQMKEGDRVILCNAEPYWVSSNKYKNYDPSYSENNLFFLEKLLKKRIQIFIAGDQHHYRRFEFIPKDSDGKPDESRKVEKITSGGGGAFLHPTHDLREKLLYEFVSEDIKDREERVFERKKDFPEENISKRLCIKNLLFLQKNKMFGSITAVLYLLVAFSLLDITQEVSGVDAFGARFIMMLSGIVRSPQCMFWIIIILAGFWLFTDTHSRRYKWIAGSLHGLSHVTAAILINCITIGLLDFGRNMDWMIVRQVISFLLVGTFGWIVGSCIMGLYLYLSLNAFGRHSNEAFSSLKIEDWKNFLRIHIDKEGVLTIYPIGLEKISKNWRETSVTDDGPLLEPDIHENEKKKVQPRLIEAPIVIRPSNCN